MRTSFIRSKDRSFPLESSNNSHHHLASNQTVMHEPSADTLSTPSDHSRATRGKGAGQWSPAGHFISQTCNLKHKNNEEGARQGCRMHPWLDSHPGTCLFQHVSIVSTGSRLPCVRVLLTPFFSVKKSPSPHGKLRGKEKGQGMSIHATLKTNPNTRSVYSSPQDALTPTHFSPRHLFLL